MLPLLATAALEKVINQALRLDPETLKRITALEGKVIALEIQGVGVEFYLVPTSDGLRVQSVFEGEADVCIRGGLFSLMRMGGARMGLVEHPASLFGKGVEMAGDTHLGRQVQQILDGLDIDWEEQVSRLTGDVMARQIGNAMRGFAQWGLNTAETLGRDVAEYLQEESRDLVVKAELTPFLDQVDTLRSDVDRLAQRIVRLNTQGDTAR